MGPLPPIWKGALSHDALCAGFSQSLPQLGVVYQGFPMSENIWKREYQRLLEEGRKTQQVVEEAAPDGGRSHPRFLLDAAHVWIRVPIRFDLVEVSIAGIAFLSHIPFTPGETLILTLDKAFSIEAQVVECVLTESDSSLMELQYRVGCIFPDESHGMQMLVMLKEMDRYRQDP